VIRNAFLEAKGYKAPKTKKTGTTIAGVMFKDGIILGADTRATEGPIVCDKNCEKIHYIAPNIYCCGAGTSADTENSTGTCPNSAFAFSRLILPCHPSHFFLARNQALSAAS
jgi:20S proteasome alpha/beta subunit